MKTRSQVMVKRIGLVPSCAAWHASLGLAATVGTTPERPVPRWFPESLPSPSLSSYPPTSSTKYIILHVPGI